MDKQIIIDGVDVSGCELYRDDNGVFAPDGTAERTELCYLTNDYCGNNPNCYYKQLKAKEQECERLKHDNGYEVGALEKTIDNLKAENEELKEKINSLLCSENCYKYKQAEKYKQTLTEIKDIAENITKLPISRPYDACILNKQIIQKIEELKVQ